MKIAIAIDLSLESHRAVRWALDLRDHMREQDRPVSTFVIYVPSPTEPFSRQNFTGFGRADDEPDIHRKLVHQARDFLESVDHNVDDIEIVVRDGDAAEIISQLCTTRRVDWLVTGKSSASALGRLLLGSTVHRIVDNPPCKTVVVHPEHARLTGPDVDLVVGVDFLPGSQAALFAAAELADHTGGYLQVVHALGDAPTGASHGGLVTYLTSTEADVSRLAQGAKRSLEKLMEDVQLRYPDLRYETSVHSGLAREILTDVVTERDSDVLVIARVRRSTVERWTLGDVSRQMLKRMATTTIFTPPETV